MLPLEQLQAQLEILKKSSYYSQPESDTITVMWLSCQNAQRVGVQKFFFEFFACLFSQLFIQAIITTKLKKITLSKT